MIATAMQPWVGRVHVGIACDVASVGPGALVFIVHRILDDACRRACDVSFGASWRCGSCCPRCLKAVWTLLGSSRPTTDAIAVHEVTASLPTPVKPRGLPPREGRIACSDPNQVEDVSAGIDPQRVAQLRPNWKRMKDVACTPWLNHPRRNLRRCASRLLPQASYGLATICYVAAMALVGRRAGDGNSVLGASAPALVDRAAPATARRFGAARNCLRSVPT